jgi:hypothetical protein
VNAPLGDRAEIGVRRMKATAAGSPTPIVAPTRQHPPPRSRSGAVTVLRVDPRVWQTALRLARGDALLIHIGSEHCVIVKNQRRR